MQASAPQPSLRAQSGGGAGDPAGVEKEPQLEAEQAVAVNVLVGFKIGKEIIAAQRSAAFAAVAGADMRSKGKVVIACALWNSRKSCSNSS